MAICRGNADDHCCYLGEAGVCQYLEENTVPGRRWACGLRRHFKHWARVHASSQYLLDVKPLLIEAGVREDCGDWPPPGKTCGTCQVVG